MRAFTNLGINLDSAPQVGVYEGHVEPTGSGLMDLVQESSTEFHKFNSALYVMDVVHEQATMESATEADAVLESVVKDSLTKIKEFFMNLWSKIKAWFERVFVMFKNLFVTGKKFIDANKKRLNEKNVLGFKYKGRKITIEAGTGVSGSLIDKIGGIIDDEAAKLAGNIESQFNDEGKLKESNEESREALLKAVGYDETSEMTKEIRLAFFNGEEPEDADEIEDFSANDKNELMEIVSASAKSVKELNKAKTVADRELGKIVKELNNTIKDVNKATDVDNKEKAAIVAVTTRISNNIKYLFTLFTTVLGATVDGVKATSKDAERILKKYINYKPAKESFSSGIEGAESVTESLLDRAMKII